MLHKFTLPNHFVYAIKNALNEFAKNGFIYDVKTFEIDNSITSFNQLVLEVEAHPFDLFNLGIKIGVMLEREK